MSTLLSPAKTYFQEKLAGVLRAIVDDPSDNVSRLAYADLLEEYGDESERARAEFIRLSLELAKWGADGGIRNPCREIALDGTGFDIDAGARRQRDLLLNLRHLVNWIPSVLHTGPGAWLRCESPPAVELGGKGFSQVAFRRGFVAVVSCTDEAFREHGPCLVRRCPLEEVRIADKKPHLMSAGTEWGWYELWTPEDGYEYRHREPEEDDIPTDVWKELDEGRTGSTGSWRWYDTPEDANRDLSQAYLRWARKQPDPTVSNPEGLD